MNKSLKSSIWVVSISLLLVVTMLVAMGIGRYSISISDIINVLLPESLSFGNTASPLTYERVLFQEHIPFQEHLHKPDL